MIELIACIAHEANRAYCITLGDHSQPNWDKAPDWQRESAMAGVTAIIANPEMTPVQSHEGWMEQKLKDGWEWGVVKDVEKKLHPCILPYASLPKEQQAKDTIFTEIVRSMARQLNPLNPTLEDKTHAGPEQPTD